MYNGNYLSNHPSELSWVLDGIMYVEQTHVWHKHFPSQQHSHYCHQREQGLLLLENLKWLITESWIWNVWRCSANCMDFFFNLKHEQFDFHKLQHKIIYWKDIHNTYLVGGWGSTHRNWYKPDQFRTGCHPSGWSCHYSWLTGTNFLLPVFCFEIII